jgi:hypothetical protein
MIPMACIVHACKNIVFLNTGRGNGKWNGAQQRTAALHIGIASGIGAGVQRRFQCD